MDFTTFLSGFLTLSQTPPASPSPLPVVSDLVDVRSVASDVVAGLVLAALIGLLTLWNKRVRGFWASRFNKLAGVGRWFADKWARLQTPIDSIPPLEKRLQAATAERAEWQRLAHSYRETSEDKARLLAVAEAKAAASTGKPLDALGLEEVSTWVEANGYRLSKVTKPKLPARFSFGIQWDGFGLFPGDLTITNRGPGTAHHVMLDSQSNVSAPEGESYWERIGPNERRQSKIRSDSIKPFKQPTLRLTWTDDDGVEHSRTVSLAKPPSVQEEEDKINREPPF